MNFFSDGEIVNVTGPIDLGLNCAVEHFDVNENLMNWKNLRIDEDGEENNRQCLIQIRSTQDLQVIRTIRASDLFHSRAIVQDYSKGILIERCWPDRQAAQDAQMELPGGHHYK